MAGKKKEIKRVKRETEIDSRKENSIASIRWGRMKRVIEVRGSFRVGAGF